MVILLSSSNDSILTRWADLLSGYFETRQTRSLAELKKMCLAGKFDAVLLHRMLVDLSAFSELSQASPLTRFFLLSDQPDGEEAISFLKMGIVGYGNTYISSPRLLEAMRVITNGGVWLGQKVIQRLITDSSAKTRDDIENTPDSTFAKLTKSERQVAEFVARGKSNLEIAADLNITERTVKAHLTSIYAKTKTGNRLNLALLINLGKSPQN